jgi:hypothetical protein
MKEEQSITSTVFLESAEELLGRLDRLGVPEAQMMSREARDLADEFRSWALRRPDEAERFATIDRLFALNRRAMDWMAHREATTPPASGVRASAPHTPVPSADPSAPEVRPLTRRV